MPNWMMGTCLSKCEKLGMAKTNIKQKVDRYTQLSYFFGGMTLLLRIGQRSGKVYRKPI